MKRFLLRVAIPALIVFAAGCATRPTWSRYEMCFGRSADSGQTRISDQQWQQFRDEEIVPRFPDGFTVYHADGYWRSDAATYSEPSEVLVVVAPDPGDAGKKLDAIARAYARRFRQESVLQITSHVEVDFHEAAAPAPAR